MLAVQSPLDALYRVNQDPQAGGECWVKQILSLALSSSKTKTEGKTAIDSMRMAVTHLELLPEDFYHIRSKALAEVRDAAKGLMVAMMVLIWLGRSHTCGLSRTFQSRPMGWPLLLYRGQFGTV